MEIDNAISRFLYIDRYTCIYLYLLHVCLSACVCIYMCVCLWAHRRKYIYIPMKENLCLDLLKDKYTLLNSKPTVSIRNSHAITLRYIHLYLSFPTSFSLFNLSCLAHDFYLFDAFYHLCFRWRKGRGRDLPFTMSLMSIDNMYTRR